MAHGTPHSPFLHSPQPLPVTQEALWLLLLGVPRRLLLLALTPVPPVAPRRWMTSSGCLPPACAPFAPPPLPSAWLRWTLQAPVTPASQPWRPRRRGRSARSVQRSTAQPDPASSGMQSGLRAARARAARLEMAALPMPAVGAGVQQAAWPLGAWAALWRLWLVT